MVLFVALFLTTAAGVSLTMVISSLSPLSILSVTNTLKMCNIHPCCSLATLTQATLIFCQHLLFLVPVLSCVLVITVAHLVSGHKCCSNCCGHVCMSAVACPVQGQQFNPCSSACPLTCTIMCSMLYHAHLTVNAP